MAKKKKWTKFRHRVVRNILYVVLKPYARIKYRIKVKKHKQRGQYLVLMNHQTAFETASKKGLKIKSLLFI